jgi:hypothetical protein
MLSFCKKKCIKESNESTIHTSRNDSTNKSEVFTWGKGGSGRLGHGDVEDRKIATLVESLRDMAVRHIACGSNFTSAICQHKWVSGAEQSQCVSCRQPFGFTRKRHNCHNCGLVHCNACTSHKVLRAALAPNPAKPYRVCDSCFMKLNSTTYSSTINKKKEVVPHHSGESNHDAKLARAIVPSNLDMIIWTARQQNKGRKLMHCHSFGLPK